MAGHERLSPFTHPPAMNEKLTAYVLNELPPDERAAVEALLKRDPELREQADEIREFCTLLEREVAGDNDTLMPKQRAQLVQRFQGARSNIRPLWRRPAFLSTIGFAAAACLAVMLAVQQVKHPEAMITAPGNANPIAGSPVDRITLSKDADEQPAGTVEVKAAVAAKKELSKAQRPAPPPAVPTSQAINDLIAIDSQPMPVLQSQPEPAAAASLKNAALGMGSTIPMEDGAMDKSIPALQFHGAVTANSLSQEIVTDVSGFTQSGSVLANPAAESTHAGINNARGLIPSNTSQQASGLAVNGGTFEYQRQDLANNQRLKSDAGAISLDLNGAGLAMNSGGGFGDARQFRMEEQTAGNPAVGNATSNAGAFDGVKFNAGKSMSDGAALAAGNEMLPGTGNASSLTKSGAGTLILNGAGTYTGATMVRGGALQDQQAIPDVRPAITLETSLSRAKVEGPAPAAAVAIPARAAGQTGIAMRSGADKRPAEELEKLATLPAERRPMPREAGQLSKAKHSGTDHSIIESPWVVAAELPLSFFPLNVGTASYANVRSDLNSGRLPPRDAVRIEELVNHFPYRYAGPGADRPFAVHVDFSDAPWQPRHRIARVAVKAREAKGGHTASVPETVAKDVKLEVEFEPAQVAAYRLIGFDGRTLVGESRNKARMDAAEIGAGHSVTALYEIVPAGLESPAGKPDKQDLKYALAPESRTTAVAAAPAAKPATAEPATKQILTVRLRYKEPDGDRSQLFEVTATDALKNLSGNDRDFQFAVSVAGFGMLLRGSPNAGDLTWDDVRRLALAGRGDDKQGPRAELIELIEKARSLSEERR